MPTTRRRRGALLATLGLVLGLVPVLGVATPASAGTSSNTNACFSGVTATYSEVGIAATGSDSPDPVTLGGPVTLSGTSITATFDPSLFVAGYRLFLLSVGANNVSADVDAVVNASNTAEGSAAQTVSTSVVVTIIDPTPATRTNGDESALPLEVSLPLSNTTWTPTGGTVNFTQGSFTVHALVGGTLPVDLGPCLPSSGLTGCDGSGANCTGFTPNPSPTPFESTTVNAPPTAPVCSNENVSVGAGQTVPINLADNCSDVNGNLDLSTLTLSGAPSAGTLTPTGPGTFSYEAPATDPGAPVTLTFTVADTGGLVSDPATLAISVLANQCDATSGPCSLTEIVLQPITGAALTFDKAPGTVMMSPVTLNGQAQVSTGTIQPVTVTNARGTSNGWDVTGYVTDLGTTGTPTISPLPGVVVPYCPRTGAGSSSGNYDGTSYDRRCIPGDNLGWDPGASITHDIIAGDVAQVSEGTADASSAADWRALLVAPGRAGVDGIGGLLEPNVLCSSPADHSGGTFVCTAALYLGIPATAAAGTYQGGLVLTLT